MSGVNWGSSLLNITKQLLSGRYLCPWHLWSCHSVYRLARGEWWLQTTMNAQLFYLLGSSNPFPTLWWKAGTPIPHNLLLPHTPIMSSYPLIPSSSILLHLLFYHLMPQSGLQQGYQLACSTMCMKAGPLETSTAWTSFHLNMVRHFVLIPTTQHCTMEHLRLSAGIPPSLPGMEKLESELVMADFECLKLVILNPSPGISCYIVWLLVKENLHSESL